MGLEEERGSMRELLDSWVLGEGEYLGVLSTIRREDGPSLPLFDFYK